MAVRTFNITWANARYVCPTCGEVGPTFSVPADSIVKTSVALKDTLAVAIRDALAVHTAASAPCATAEQERLAAVDQWARQVREERATHRRAA